MSRQVPLLEVGHACFPRVSGDEPAYRFQDKNRSMFSPRERG